jgi:DHA2 family multidrug resistance protein
VAVYLVRQTQANHALLSEHISPFNESIRHVPLPEAWNLADVSGLAVLNAVATRQAALLAYIDDFRWLTVMVVVSIPLLLFVRMPRQPKRVASTAKHVNHTERSQFVEQANTAEEFKVAIE